MPQRILAVDDERYIARLIQINLEKAGYQTFLAVDGVDALEKVQTLRPDMVVCDVMMPRMDGFEVLRRLKADPETRNLPIIMLTAKAQEQDIFNGWASGADAYLTKPFNPKELISFVRRIFDAQSETLDGSRIVL